MLNSTQLVSTKTKLQQIKLNEAKLNLTETAAANALKQTVGGLFKWGCRGTVTCSS